MSKTIYRHCKKHGLTEYGVYPSSKRKYCKNCANERLRSKRKNNKDKLISLFGKSCKICGYNKTNRGLAFHHKKDKKFTIAQKSHHSFNILLKEAKKCILLCAKCHAEEHYNEEINSTTRLSKGVMNWRLRTKKKAIKCLGGKCRVCAYNKCPGALDFHHVNPSEKKFQIADALRNPKSWDKIKIELKKCILLCNICHIEYHEGIIDIPQNIIFMPISYSPKIKKNIQGTERQSKAKISKIKLITNCKVCDMLTHNKKYCSPACSSKSRERINWDEIDLAQIIKENNGNFSKIGRILGVTDNAIRKQARKRELI